ncbi:MAG: Hsp20/alpha crystallin family protein [Chloroflexota bacterium]
MAEKTVPATREESSPRERTRAEGQHIAPPVDIYEATDSLVVVADMPGVQLGDVDVRVEQGILTLEARTRHELSSEPYYREFQLANFFRQFQLSDEVDVDKISAELKNGVLTLNLPKSEAAKPKRIQVRAQ